MPLSRHCVGTYSETSSHAICQVTFDHSRLSSLSRLITIRLRAVPFNITIVQAYAPTSDYDDNEIEEFYDQLQNVIDKTPKKDILVVQGDWNATWAGMPVETGKAFVDPSAMITQMRKDSDFWSLPPLTILCW